MDRFILQSTVQEAPFGGLSTFEPTLLPPGALTQADNVVWDRGILKTRPGFIGQLATALGTPIYECTPFRDSDGTSALLFATGTGIRRWRRGATTTTLVSGAVAFTASAVQMTTLGGYIFLTGAADNNLYRYRISDATFESAAGFTRPGATTFSGTLIFRYLTDLATVAQWKNDTLASPNLTVPDFNFAAASTSGVSAGSDLSTGWTVTSGVVEASSTQSGLPIDPAAPSQKFVRLDEPGSAVLSKNPILTSPFTNANGVSDAASYPVHFVVKTRYKATFSSDSYLVTLVAYSDTGATSEITRQSVLVTAIDINAVYDDTRLFSFQTVTEDIRAVKVILEAGTSNRAGSNGPYITNVVVKGFFTPTAYNNSGGKITLSHYSDDDQGLTTWNAAGMHFAYDMGATTGVLQNEERLSLPFQNLGLADTPRFRLGFRTGLTTTRYLSDEMEYIEATADTSAYYTVDISAIAASLSNIRYIDLIVVGDVKTRESLRYNAYLPLFTLAGLTLPGNLTPLLPYEYCVREAQSAGTSDEITSKASPLVGFDTVTHLTATAQLTLAPVPANSLSPAVEIEWYRRGGRIGQGGDNTFYLVARVPSSGTDTGTYYTWDATTGVFTDNTPDAALFGAQPLVDHDNPPTGVLAVGTFAGRLVAADTERIYLSQIAFGRATGLYWNLVTDENSPTLKTDGETLRLTGRDGGVAGDTVVRMVNHHTRLEIYYRNGPYLLLGERPPFDVRRYEAEEAKGAVSAYAVKVADNATIFLADDGLNSFDGADLSNVSGEIEKLLNPAVPFDGPGLDPAAYRSAVLVLSGPRLFLSAPLPGESAVSVAYVFDRRANEGQGVWVRWLTGAVTGGFAFRGQGESDELFFTTAAGQIFRVGPTWGDKATSGSSTTAVSIAVSGREITVFRRELLAQRWWAEVECGDASASVTFSVTADGDTTARVWSQAFSWDGTALSRIRTGPLRIANRVRGGRLVMKVTGTSLSPILLRQWEMTAVTGRIL